jgi:pimeloyl-ACP methyl ester carboxylesterase
MSELQVGVQRIRIDEAGEGPPVLLLHSSGMSSLQWRRLKERLASSYRVLAPDFIGYGGSAPWEGKGAFEYRFDLEVAEAIALQAGQPVHVVGHSYGGLIALKLAERGKVAVASLAAFEPVAFGVLASRNAQEALADLARLDADGTFFAPELQGTPEWSERFVDFWGGPGYWARLPEWQRAAFLAPGRKMFEEVRTVSYDRTPHEAYAHIQAPALFMTGSRSPPAGQRTVEILAESLPHGRLAVIEGAGHMGPLTHSEQVNALIAEHLQQNTKR